MCLLQSDSQHLETVPINETDRIPRLLATLQFLVVYHLLVFLEQ